jgi:hypothetical protein
LLAPREPASRETQQHAQPAGRTAAARAATGPEPPEPRDPVSEKGNRYWRDFESLTGEGRIAVFLETLDDAEVLTGGLAFEMLSVLHADALKSGDRMRFAECVNALRERQPEVYLEDAHYYLSWCLRDALAENRQEVIPSLAWELAARAGRDIDTVNRALDALSYHGQLDVLVGALRIAWPSVKSSDKIVPWGISEFANKGADHEIYAYLEHTASPDPADPVLLDRIKLFVDDPIDEYLRQFIGDLTGESAREWHSNDFALKKPRKRRRDEWDDEPEETQTPDQGAINLSRLISAFVGYLRREEGVPFPRGELVRQELYRYFMRRNEGDLDPRPSMLEAALHPERKLPKPPRPVHSLCPERVTLDVHLAGLMNWMNGQYHLAAALFLAMPAWLRFLKSRSLIDADASENVVEELRPLHATLMKIWEQFTEDPLLYHQGQSWPA